MIKFLHDFGIEIVVLLSGLAGGLVSLRKESQISRSEKIMTVISGGLIANYMTPLVQPLIGKIWDVDISPGLGFILGYMGLSAIEYFILKFKKEVK